MRFDLELPVAAEDDLTLADRERLPEWHWKTQRGMRMNSRSTGVDPGSCPATGALGPLPGCESEQPSESNP
ncbi:MAG: hypothetical protein K9L32_00570 [Chromatiaceae bacterium]|nr:hypothetical protein [Chromatiaceae bacterium]MCF8002698.1 hypothetical protein [Chromatiaceae bacterium]